MNNIDTQIETLIQEEEPYVGMPITELNWRMEPRHRHEMDRRGMDHENCRHMMKDPLAGMPLAMAYVPWQQWCDTYEPAEALHRGTIFPELDLPFLGGEC